MAKKSKAKPKAHSPATIQASPEARKKACAMLEVLSGLRSPGEAAQELNVSMPRYYTLETRALEGFVKALEPREKGRGARTAEAKLEDMTKERDGLKAELLRTRTMLRVARRAVGLVEEASLPAAKNGKKKAKRRKTNRGRKVLAALKPKDREPEKPAPGKK